MVERKEEVEDSAKRRWEMRVESDERSGSSL